MERFVHNQNLLRFVEALEFETDSGKRQVLQHLLLEEENRFGERRARLEQTEEMILRGQERISRQRALVSRLECAGEQTETAEACLSNLLHTQSLFEMFRDTLLRGSNAAE